MSADARTRPPAHWARPGLFSLALALAEYSVLYGLFVPGYAINDDMKIIAIAAGYPGVTPAPFLVFSNVLLGFVLTPLYRLGLQLNWEIAVFSILNICSLWMLLWLILSAKASSRWKAWATVLVLACAAYYALNITFTSVAALACFSGLAALLQASRRLEPRAPRLAALGGLLVLAGALVRIQMLILVLPLVLAAAVFFLPELNARTAIIAGGATVLVVAGAYGFDRLYVRAHPAWNAYYHYNQAAASIQDSHRLENTHLEIRHIGWSPNDQELFARYFFPDEGVFSLERLQFLQSNVSAIGGNPFSAVREFLARLNSLQPAGFLLVCLAALLATFASGDLRAARGAVVLVIVVSLAENWFLVWVYKNPDYVLFSSLANTAILSTILVIWLSPTAIPLPAWPFTTGVSTGIRLSLAASALAVSGLFAQTTLTSIHNLHERTGYARILADLGRLQRQGQLAQDAVIISPAHGLPWEWSNPLLLGFPGIPYLDTGWITFSPSYEEALHVYGINSLPRALYEKGNLYLVTKSIFKGFLQRYYQEHEGHSVSFDVIYTLPNPYGFAGYDNVELYRVIRAP